LGEIRKLLPKYDYLYLGDNARTPYGTRSFELVYEFTLQAVKKLFEEGCPLIILACNTASAKALRTIQQNDLPLINPEQRVLGVIRPTAEIVNNLTNTGHVGVLGTPGTIASSSYTIEIQKLFPSINVTGEACPMWVPLIENQEADKEGADYFVKQHLDNLLSKDPLIDTIILGCTHYPLLLDKIKKYIPKHIQLISQGEYVASSLENYLYRHPEMDSKLSKEGSCRFLTTDSSEKFDTMASLFLQGDIHSERINLG